ncbi:hypothetical protein [Paenibacillus sp. SN-8-1]|uniref:hypothetical protein n=1 Tax=Paenibacillus sp. SN-8-1 TaxID=3435409 RepID=UPI003D9A0F16
MNLQIRIKASTEYADLFALSKAGGWYVPGKNPKFAFNTEQQRQAYERIRKGELKDGSVPEESHKKTGEVARRHYGRGSLRSLD